MSHKTVTIPTYIFSNHELQHFATRIQAVSKDLEHDRLSQGLPAVDEADITAIAALLEELEWRNNAVFTLSPDGTITSKKKVLSS